MGGSTVLPYLIRSFSEFTERIARISRMPKPCVAGGCSRGTKAGISLYTSPKDPIRRSQLRALQ